MLFLAFEARIRIWAAVQPLELLITSLETFAVQGQKTVYSQAPIAPGMLLALIRDKARPRQTGLADQPANIAP